MNDLLRSIWDEPRAPHPPQRWWRDGVLAALLVALAVLEASLRPDLPWRAVSVTVAIGLVPTLFWRRSRPLLMMVIAFGISDLVSLVASREAGDMYTMAYLVLLPYALLRWGSGREIVLGSAVMLGQVGVPLATGNLSLTDAIGSFAVLSAVIGLGLALRFRASARTRALERVKLLEREKLARDLHDTVAHHVSAMAIRAQAGLATMEGDPEAAAEALRVIEAEASRALAEMRAMVRVLRDDEPAELAPSPQIGDLRQLAGKPRSGPSVEVNIAGAVEDLAPSVGTAIYRLAQESVTNARRHARHATRIEVHVEADDAVVCLRVSDDGDLSRLRPGYGLIGMRERASLLGGRCEAGPNPGRGWTVTAMLPRSGVPS